MLPSGCMSCGFPGSGDAATAVGYTNPAISASIHLRNLRRKRNDARSQATEARRLQIEQSSHRDKKQTALYIVISVLFGLYFIGRAAGLY